jgi:RNA polymerase sigma factor (sigma-70 family)
MASSFLPGRGAALFERYYRELLNFLARKVGDRELAADLAQESYARVYATPNNSEVAEPRALLYTTARNLITDHHRRASVRAQVEVPGEPDEQGDTQDLDIGIGPESLQPEAVFSGRQRLAAIEEVVTQLPPRPREAFVLYKLDGLSRGEVADQMGVSIKTVETHLAIAMEACVRRLQQLDGTAPGAPAPPKKKARVSR